MATLIDRLTLAVYDDGSIECAAENNNLTVDQAAATLGAAIRAGIIERDGLEEYQKNVYGNKDKAVKAFCDGMDYFCAGMADWFSPENAPDEDMMVLFGVKEDGKVITCCGEYVKEYDEFRVTASKYTMEYAVYKRSEIMCWMLLPFPISFEKKEEIRNDYSSMEKRYPQ